MQSLDALIDNELGTWFDLGPYTAAYERAVQQLEDLDLCPRIWAHDARLWTQDADILLKIANRLGWLDLPSEMPIEIDRLIALAAEACAAHIDRVILLGMGGSSLAPEVMRAILGKATGYPELVVLDTTDPTQIRRIAAPLDNTLFLVASKSGTTAETANLLTFFKAQLIDSVGTQRYSKHLIAITDSGTALEATARAEGFRAIYLNSPDLGGRFSALSLYGLVPAALIGNDLERLLASAREMAQACGLTRAVRSNPGAMLGAIMGACSQTTANAANLPRRDKLTLLTSPGLEAFGPWLEQLVAESTGKNGVGILPVEGEWLPEVGDYGPDRLFAYLRLDGANNRCGDERVGALVAAGHPVVALRLRNPYDLGAEFFRWEFATAVTGILLGINPFDQPNVEAAKTRAREALARYEQEHALPRPHPRLQRGALTVYGPEERRATVADYIAAWLDQAEPGDYVALMAYIERSPEHSAQLQKLRTQLAATLHLAVTVGFGPRFLHSTGQLHKGGPNTGLFLQLTQQETSDLPIPERTYSFGVLKQAQALGDLEALQHAGRRTLRIDLGSDVREGLAQLQQAIQQALAQRL